MNQPKTRVRKPPASPIGPCVEEIGVPAARVLRRFRLALASLDAQTLERLESDLSLLIAALDADERGAGVPLGPPDLYRPVRLLEISPA